MVLPLYIALAIASLHLWGRRVGYLKQIESNGGKENCISELPDDILFSILSRLSFRDAVKTSILSRRWRYLYTSMPNLDFNSLTMFDLPKKEHVCRRYLEKFVEVVNQFIQLYSGPKISSFRFVCCFKREFAVDIDRWISFAISKGVEELDINFQCNKYLFCHSNVYYERKHSCQLLSKASNLKRLHLHKCIVMPSFNVKLNSLKSLDLDGLLLAGREMEDILSCCSNLEQLRIRKCIVPAKLCICGPSLRLKLLTINDCESLETIDLCAINLTLFECFGHELIKFSFSRVPKLERVFLHMNREMGMPHIFSELPKDLPQLKTLLVRTATMHVRYIPARITLLSSLRQLELILTTYEKIDLLTITPILSDCPLLQKFCLVTTSSSCNNYIGTEEPPLCHHTQLEEVEFGGFRGTQNELSLALYFIRSAAVLKRMSISTKFGYYCGFGNWENKCFLAWNEEEREMIRRHLQGKALSRSAELIVI